MTCLPEQPAEGTERTAAAIAWAADTLAAAGVASPRADAELLTAHVLGVPRSRLVLVDGLTAAERARLAELVAHRVRRVPVQHLTGRAGFRYLDLAVGPGVFIPRPETELLAGWGIAALTRGGRLPNTPDSPDTPDSLDIPDSPDIPDSLDIPDSPDIPDGSDTPGSSDAPDISDTPGGPDAPDGPGGPDGSDGSGDRAGPVVVDLCSGSGAVALAVANEVPAARVYAVEADPAALDWLRRNASARAAAGDRPVEVVTGDVTDPDLLTGPTPLAHLRGRVDLVLCNPPYVPTDTPVPPEVANGDPERAVFGGPDGLAVIAPVIKLAAALLRPGGAAGIEHDESHAPAVLAAFARDGDFTDVTGHRDLAGRPRFATASRVHGRLLP